MLNKKCGGFVFAEFAIALPLLILLGYGLAIVGVEMFRLGKNQLADYVLEAEAQYVMERITHQARFAKEVKVDNDRNSIMFIYHTVNDRPAGTEIPTATGKNYQVFAVYDVLERQYFIPRRSDDDSFYENINAKRIDDGNLTNPITGENFFGNTKIISLQFKELNNNVLHISLEMESLITERRIKLNTAVFMPNCDTKEGLRRD